MNPLLICSQSKEVEEEADRKKEEGKEEEMETEKAEEKESGETEEKMETDDLKEELKEEKETSADGEKEKEEEKSQEKGRSNYIDQVQWMHVWKNRAQNYKTFFTLNSTEHEILNAHKYKNVKKFSFFQTQISRECYFSC